MGVLLRSGVVVLVLATAGRGLAAENWIHYRGPDADGHVDDAKAPLRWSETENLLWKTKLPGRGNSSPIVWGDRVFLTASSKDGLERYLVCVNSNTGKMLWQKTVSKGVPPGRTHSWNGYASASCATDGERVYAFFGTPGLFCYDFAGNQVWHHDFGVFTSATGWGEAASPFLYEDLVIQNCDNDGPAALPKGSTAKAAPMSLVALDKYKGTIRWETPRNQGRGYSTPRLLDGPGGRLELILNGPKGVWSYEPRTGKEIWHCERRADREQNKFGEMIPVTSGSVLFAPSGRPGPMQAIRLGGTGDVTKTHLVWETRRKGRDCSSQLLVGDLLYACDNKAILTCFDAKTGDVVYAERISPEAKSLASPLYIQGKLVFVLDTGETVIVEPGRELKIVARNVLGNNQTLDFNASPAVVDGTIYIRSQSHLYAIGSK